MRRYVHTFPISFRASERLVSALHERARQSEMSPSEYLRSIVREKVGSDLR